MAAEIDVLKQLEEQVQASINRIQQLQRENELLAKRLAESEQRCSEANDQLRGHEHDRGEIRSRIEKILARFDGLELGIGTDSNTDSNNDSNTDSHTDSH